MRIFLATSLAIGLFLSPVRAQPLMEPGPKTPAESLQCLKPRPGFTAELMAAEPLVMSPIAFAWGPDGKFWVVEMGDYPLGIDGKNKFGGKVKFLEKSRPDGPYDKATLFLDNLGYPTGVTPWGKGVIVTCAPDIFYAEDTDGDGKADKKVVLYTGFREGNQQHRVNGLVWGLDNWLYGANGDSGGTVKSVKTGAVVNISGRDFRIKPDEGLIEAVSGQTQFGRSRDDWGNWFGNNNSDPMYHYVLEDRYLKRNPHVLYPDVRVRISEKPGASEVYPISKALPRFNNPGSVNHFTSACSAIVYRDDLFGPEFANNTFVSEPVHNLVHREIMTPKGVTFTSRRAADEQTSEFLASSDNWFRPTTIQTGPDGALWVADMYRYVIEHPEWIPKDWQKKLDLRAGADKGRIYRVYPEGKKPRAIPRLDRMSIEELVKALDSPSGWQRDTAQRLVILQIAELEEKIKASLNRPEGKMLSDQRTKTKNLLRKVAKESNNPLARLHALGALDSPPSLVDVLDLVRGPRFKKLWSKGREGGILFTAGADAVDAAMAERAAGRIKDLEVSMADRDGGVRRHAMRVLEAFLNDCDSESDNVGRRRPLRVLESFMKEYDHSHEPLLHDPDPQVRMELAYSLGYSQSPRAGEFLGRLFADHQDDRYMTAAVLSSVHKKNWPSFFATLLEKNAIPAYAQANLMKLVTVFGSNEDKMNLLVNRLNQQQGKSRGEQFAMLANLLDNLEGGKSSLSQWLDSSADKVGQAKLAKIKDIMRVARTVIADPKAPVREKALALRLVGLDPEQWESDRKLLRTLLVPQVDENLQMAAAQRLGKINDPRITGQLLEPWKSYSPALRAEVLGIVLSRPEWTRLLMDALDKKQVLPTELDAIRRQQLMQHKDLDIRRRAETLLAAASNPDRNKVVMHYVLTVPPNGDGALGKKIFVKHCAACHQLGGVGQQVGPDLASVPDKSLEGLLTSILDPNRVVEARYVNYLATTKSGLTLSGVLFGETTTSITLVAADGKKHELLRRDLDELASTGKSPMPEGLEKDIPQQDMADLIAFLRAGIPDKKPKHFDGNRPEPVKADAKGVLKLLPQNGAIYGKTLVMETKHGNLGYWSSDDDHVVWTLEVPAAGTYAVELEWACADDSAGNTILFQAGAKKMTLKVTGTGTWDDYRVNWIGTVELPHGKTEVTARPEGTIRGALIDLKGIYLVPKK